MIFKTILKIHVSRVYSIRELLKYHIAIIIKTNSQPFLALIKGSKHIFFYSIFYLKTHNFIQPLERTGKSNSMEGTKDGRRDLWLRSLCWLIKFFMVWWGHTKWTTIQLSPTQLWSQKEMHTPWFKRPMWTELGKLARLIVIAVPTMEGFHIMGFVGC